MQQFGFSEEESYAPCQCAREGSEKMDDFNTVECNESMAPTSSRIDVCDSAKEAHEKARKSSMMPSEYFDGPAIVAVMNGSRVIERWRNGENIG
jgi:hypothetical protein